MTMKTIIFCACLSRLFIKTETADPCKTYFKMIDMTRSVNYKLDLNNQESDDGLLVPGWYRMVINGTDANMPTACPSVFQCGSTKPIWFNGTLPEKDKELTRIGCYSGFTSCCEKSFNITVKNCDMFNVYNLQKLSSSSGRYCAVKRKRCVHGFSSESGYEPCRAINISFNEIPSVEYIEPDHNTEAEREKRMLRFKCQANIPPINKRDVFDIRWEVNERTIIPVQKNMHVDELTTKGLLTTKNLIANGFKTVGFRAKCSIRARANPNSTPTLYKESKEFYAGMQVSTDNITVIAGKVALVKIRSTVPIACEIYKGARIPKCEYRFEMLDLKVEVTASNAFCKQKVKRHKSGLCGVKFNAWQWNKYQILKIPTNPNQQIMNHIPAIVQLKSLKDNGDIMWDDYQLPDIKINIRGVDFNPATCQSITDPHITTFDGSLYTTFASGEYVLYKHKSKPIFVHVIQRSLGGNPTWNCAIAVRAASDTFIVYGCSGGWKSRRSFCDRTLGSYLDVYKRNQGKEYEVHLPTGARVKIVLNSGMYMNVYIYASTLDEGQTSGLCGTFNRNIHDEFTKPNGAKTDQNSFVKSWHVKSKDSMFIAKARAGSLNTTRYFCSCVNNSTADKKPIFSNQANCDWQDAMPVCAAPHYSEEQCRFRAKRDEYDNMDIDIDVPDDIVKFESAPLNIGVWRNGWNESAAVDKCRNVLHTSRFYKQCKDLVLFDEKNSIRTCTEDIKFLGHSNMSSEVDKPLRESCLNIIRVNTSLWTSTKTDPHSGITVLSSIVENDCPNDCSVGEEKRGLCKNGTCQCFTNFVGDDCSIDTQKAPDIMVDERESRCDATTRGCTHVSLFGDNFFNNGKGFKCRLEEQQVHNNTDEIKSATHLTDAELVSFSEVRCPIPNGGNRKRRDVSFPQAAGFLVSVTNNGNAFSNRIPIVLYDSSCTDCILVNGAFICLQKDNICIVNGNCYDLSSSACTSMKVEKVTESKHLWIIGAVLSVFAVLVVVCLIVAKTVMKPRTKTGSSYPSVSVDAYFANSKAVYSKS